MKKVTISSVFLFVCISVASGEEVVRELSWEKLKESDLLLAGEIQSFDPPGPVEALKIENTESTPKTIQILVLDDPGVSAIRYALAGKIRYDDVEDISYLETWNHFSNGDACFTRSLADSGPLGNIRGSSGWRKFSLPFHSLREVGAPTKIVLNVVLTGRGTVYLSPIRVVQYGNAFTAATAHSWWGLRVSIVIGAGGGTLLGILGAVIGILGGLGRARRFVMGLTASIFLVGVVCFVAGVVAVFTAQPYHVGYPLLLIGVVCSVVGGPLFFMFRRRFEQLELRKMTSMDVAPSTGPDASPASL